MTPYQISILLHYYCSASDWNGMDAPIWRETINGLIRDGLIKESDMDFPKPAYCITDKGNFYVRHGLCNIPLPVQKFRIPYEEIK